MTTTEDLNIKLYFVLFQGKRLVYLVDDKWPSCGQLATIARMGNCRCGCLVAIQKMAVIYLS